MESAKIIHIDMDCFYAQVEMRDNPKYQNKPVIISGPPNTRSVVCTASYEARKFGVHSAMSATRAFKLCPSGIFIPPNFQKYREVSKQIHEIFRRYTDIIEPLSLDEAYLDLTDDTKQVSATLIAYEIQKAIYEELNLTCSIGVSYNKLLAKIGSDFKKPGGITVVEPHKATSFLENLSIDTYPGVGKKAKKRMYEYAIYTGKDFKKLDQVKAQKLFGKLGRSLYQYVRGVDNREVNTNRISKSIGCEYTMQVDLESKAQIKVELKKIAKEAFKRIQKQEKCFKTVTLKIKYDDFSQITRAKTLPYYEYNEEILYQVSCELLKNEEIKSLVRLVGITVSTLKPKAHIKEQLKIEQILLKV